jgi:hypothetical protein
MRPGFSGSIAQALPACWRERWSRTWRQGQRPGINARKKLKDKKRARRFSNQALQRGGFRRAQDRNQRRRPAGIIEEYLLAHGDFEFDEIEIVNNRPMNIWLHAKCRKYIDTDASAEEQQDQISQAAWKRKDGSREPLHNEWGGAAKT